MKPNSLVVYTGGQCDYGKSVAPLKLFGIYTISEVIDHTPTYLTAPVPYFRLHEMPQLCEKTGEPYAFIYHMFKEIDPPREINLEEIIKITQP